jgi:hypothetical protein
MVKRRVAILVGFLLCTLLVGRATSGASLRGVPNLSAQDSDFTMEGKITDKTASKLTISSGENIIFHVLYNDQTEIKRKDGSPGTAQDLHIGVNIQVAGSLAESGEITAKKIEIEAEGSKEH